MATNREITRWIIIHSSHTPPYQDIGLPEIRKWHIANGKSDCGYHYVIRRTGDVEVARGLRTIGSHCKGYNSTSVGICLIGGASEEDLTPEDNFTSVQKESLIGLLEWLTTTYPEAVVIGHSELKYSEYATRDEENWVGRCPGFDVGLWYKNKPLVAHTLTQLIMLRQIVAESSLTESPFDPDIMIDTLSDTIETVKKML